MTIPDLAPRNCNNNPIFGLPDPPETDNDSYPATMRHLKKVLKEYVDLKANQIIAGNKTFTGNIIVEKTTRTSAIVVSFVTKTENYTIKSTDCTVNGDATTGNIIFLLPPAASLSPGQQFKSAKADSTANTVSIQAAAGDNIIGAPVRVLSSPWESVVCETDGNKTWFIY